MSDHTPGPWERYGLIGQSGLTRVRACIGEDQVGRKQFVNLPANSADAKLIAAAPAMLDALHAIVKHQDAIGGTMAKLSGVRAIAAKAIAEATGEIV